MKYATVYVFILIMAAALMAGCGAATRLGTSRVACRSTRAEENPDACHDWSEPVPVSPDIGTNPMAGDALVSSGPKGIAALLGSERVTITQDVQRLLTDSAISARSVLPIARYLLVHGKGQLADALIEAGAQEDRRTPNGNEHQRYRDRIYASWLIANDRLDQRLAQLQRLPDPSPAALRQIAVLCLANGDFPSALDYADRIKDADLTLEARYGLGAWEALAAMPDETNELDRFGHVAAYYRRAENRNAFETTIRDIHAYIDRHMPEARTGMLQHPENGVDWYTAKILMVNDRLQDACDVLARAQNYVQLAEILSAMDRHEEALAVIQRALAEKDPWARLLRALEVRILSDVGATEQARTAALRFLDERSSATDDQTVAAMITGAIHAGLTTEAATLAASVLDNLPPDRTAERNSILSALLGEYWDAFGARWLPLLRQAAPEQSTATHLLLLRGCIDRENDSLGRFALLTDQMSVLTARLPQREQINAWEDQAYAHTERGDLAAAIQCRRRACELVSQDNPSDRSGRHMILAKDLMASSEWALAAESARLAFEARESAASLWAEGWARAKGGQKQAGAEIIEQARLLAATSIPDGVELANWMARLGAPELAARQNELVFRVASLSQWDKWLCAKAAGDFAWQKGDFAKAVAYGEAGRFAHVTSRMAFGLTAYGYLNVMWQLHAAAASGAAASGHIDEMTKHVRLAREAQPADVSLAIMLVPVLEKAGHREAADQVFSKAFEFHTALTRTYPQCVTAHGAIALLSARTGRALPEALSHARLAVALAPDKPSYRSNLAEILFRLGDREEAVSEMRRCIALAPTVKRYQEQLLSMRKDAEAHSTE
jgi:tetratricopeptide (TPR) repeat protein